MCGIAGLYDRPDGAATVREMAARIAHRGPDASGVYERNGGEGCPDVRLAHLRLSIIDLSTAGNQPFVKDGLALVYNGELYNFPDLKRGLEAKGVAFRSATDTEVVLEAWRAWGPAALPRLRGMFAFAMYEEMTGRLVLARDHFGIKPLFMARRGGGLAFASELKGLLPALDAPAIDTDALVASLLYYWIPESHCVYRGVTKLPAGHWAEITPDGTYAEHCYWSPVEDLTGRLGSLDVDGLADVVEQSVHAHLIADVPVSTFLSGGLDSSYITALAKQANPAVDAYTISFRPEDRKLEAMPDDLHYARIVAKRYGVDLHEIEIAPDVVDLLPRLVGILDEPIGDPAAINTYLICSAARERGIKVLLSGMGADELFGGYRKHYANLLAARYRRIPAPLRRGVVEPLVDRLPVAVGDRGLTPVRWAKRFLNFASLAEEPAFRRSYTQFGEDELAGLLAPDLLPAVGRLFAEHADVYNNTGFDEPVNRMCMTDVQMFMVGLNLAYTDRASMAASTEVRVPFIDLEVARAAFSFSGTEKIQRRERKAVLKQAARRVLPDEIVYRPKGLFSAPLRAWIRRDLAGMIDDVLPDGQLVRQGLLERSAITRLVAEDRGGRQDRAKEIWQLLTLEEWLRQAVPTPGASPVPIPARISTEDTP